MKANYTHVTITIIAITCVATQVAHGNDSIYSENEYHGQPPKASKHVQHYVQSPPEPFNKKGTWYGTVHYDWGWYQGPWLNGRWHTEEGEVGHCHHWYVLLFLPLNTFNLSNSSMLSNTFPLYMLHFLGMMNVHTLVDFITTKCMVKEA